MGMNIDHMREFVVLASNLNFSVTAEQLYVSQPSLTRHIIQIEEELGVQLLYRTTHDVALTKAGKFVQEKFSEIIMMYDQLSEEMAALSEGFHGNLKIGAPYYAIDCYVIPLLVFLKEKMPEIKIDIYTYQLKQIIPELLKGVIDIGILYEALYASSRYVNFYPFAHETMKAAISVENPLKDKENLNISDIANARFIRIEDHEWLNNYVDVILRENQLELTDCVYTPQIDTLKIDLVKEKGVALVQSHLCILAGKELVFREVEGVDKLLKMCFTTSTRNDNPLVKSVIKEVLENDPFDYRGEH